MLTAAAGKHSERYVQLVSQSGVIELDGGRAAGADDSQRHVSEFAPDMLALASSYATSMHSWISRKS